MDLHGYSQFPMARLLFTKPLKTSYTFLALRLRYEKLCLVGP